jgi:hypothetical protein
VRNAWKDALTAFDTLKNAFHICLAKLLHTRTVMTGLVQVMNPAAKHLCLLNLDRWII